MAYVSKRRGRFLTSKHNCQPFIHRSAALDHYSHVNKSISQLCNNTSHCATEICKLALVADFPKFKACQACLKLSSRLHPDGDSGGTPKGLQNPLTHRSQFTPAVLCYRKEMHKFRLIGTLDTTLFEFLSGTWTITSFTDSFLQKTHTRMLPRISSDLMCISYLTVDAHASSVVPAEGV